MQHLLLLLMFIESVQERFPQRTGAQIKMDMRQKLSNAVKTSKRHSTDPRQTGNIEASKKFILKTRISVDQVIANK